VPRKEESLIEEMRAAIARDRERVRSGSPLAAGSGGPEQAEPEPETPQQERRRSLVGRLLGRGR
jgi:hypothetical protein